MELKTTDNQIDKLVYDLYDLTEEEIAIVEEGMGVKQCHQYHLLEGVLRHQSIPKSLHPNTPKTRESTMFNKKWKSPTHLCSSSDTNFDA